MEKHKEESSEHAIIRLASAVEHMADEMGRMADHQAEMNGSVQQHTTQLALGSQWMKNHIGTVHETLEKRLVTTERLARLAVGVQIILALGLVIGTWLVAVR